MLVWWARNMQEALHHCLVLLLIRSRDAPRVTWAERKWTDTEPRKGRTPAGTTRVPGHNRSGTVWPGPTRYPPGLHHPHDWGGQTTGKRRERPLWIHIPQQTIPPKVERESHSSQIGPEKKNAFPYVYLAEPVGCHPWGGSVPHPGPNPLWPVPGDDLQPSHHSKTPDQPQHITDLAVDGGIWALKASAEEVFCKLSKFAEKLMSCNDCNFSFISWWLNHLKPHFWCVQIRDIG